MNQHRIASSDHVTRYKSNLTDGSKTDETEKVYSSITMKDGNYSNNNNKN